MARLTYVNYYLNALCNSPAEYAQWLAGTQIDSTRLKEKLYSVDILCIRRFVENIVQLEKSPLLGIELGKNFGIKDLGIMGHALMSCDSVLDAAHYWNHFNPLIGNLLTYPLKVEDELVQMQFTELCPLENLLPFCVEQSLMSSLNIYRELTGEPTRYKKIQVTYSKPKSETVLKAYQECFGCPVVFEGPTNTATFTREGFDLSITTADQEALEVFDRYCNEVMSKFEREEGIIGSIRQILFKNPRGAPKLPELAAKLRTSERTLRRKLSNEGTSYSNLLNDFKKDLTLEYVRDSQLSAKEIAYLVGYDNPASFNRAFKTWTGQTFNEYKQDQSL